MRPPTVAAMEAMELADREKERRMQEIRERAKAAGWVSLWSTAFTIYTIALLLIGGLLERNDMERKAVTHGAARFNPQTAAFEWIDKPQQED